MYVASACLVLILIIMGVSMVNSFDRMKTVQSTLEALADTSDEVETRETSGSVTAVTSEEQTGEGDTSDDQAVGSDDGQAPDDQSAQENDGQDQSSQDARNSSGLTDENGTDSSDENTASEENGSNGVYIVEEGDTLAIISRKMYGDVDHVDAICRMNGITDGNLIYVGQKLLLP